MAEPSQRNPSLSPAEALAKQGKPPESEIFAKIERSRRFQQLTEEGFQDIERGEYVRLEDIKRELGDV